MYFLSLFFYWAFLSLESRHSYMFKFMTVTGLGGSFIALQRDSYPEAPVLSACAHLCEGGQVM